MGHHQQGRSRLQLFPEGVADGQEGHHVFPGSPHRLEFEFRRHAAFRIHGAQLFRQRFRHRPAALHEDWINLNHPVARRQVVRLHVPEGSLPDGSAVHAQQLDAIRQMLPEFGPRLIIGDA